MFPPWSALLCLAVGGEMRNQDNQNKKGTKWLQSIGGLQEFHNASAMYDTEQQTSKYVCGV